MTRYRQVLAVPGMAPLLGISLLARAAITADVIALTMYVVLDLDMSYAAAGTASAALAAGVGLGGQPVGRMIDRRGLRAVMSATVAAQIGFWLSVPALPYVVLLPAAFVAGLLMVPVQSVVRQAIAAMTTSEHRRPAFALESVMGELSYIVGPAVVLLLAAKVSAGVTAWVLGAAIVAGGVAIIVLNPPLRSQDEAADAPAQRPRRREWLKAPMIAVLVMVIGTTILLNGIDLAVVATLKESGQVSWASVVVVVLGLASVTGGLAYGALPRSMPTWLLLGLLGLLTIPAGLATGWPALCVTVLGAGLLTAPTLSALADAVSRLAPASVRGEATGLQSAAASLGFALGTPTVGAIIDSSVPAGGFAAAGLIGLLAAALGLLMTRRLSAAALPSPGEADRKPVPPKVETCCAASLAAPRLPAMREPNRPATDEDLSPAPK